MPRLRENTKYLIIAVEADAKEWLQAMAAHRKTNMTALVEQAISEKRDREGMPWALPQEEKGA